MSRSNTKTATTPAAAPRARAAAPLRRTGNSSAANATGIIIIPASVGL